MQSFQLMGHHYINTIESIDTHCYCIDSGNKVIEIYFDVYAYITTSGSVTQDVVIIFQDFWNQGILSLHQTFVEIC